MRRKKVRNKPQISLGYSFSVWSLLDEIDKKIKEALGADEIKHFETDDVHMVELTFKSKKKKIEGLAKLDFIMSCGSLAIDASALSFYLKKLDAPERTYNAKPRK